MGADQLSKQSFCRLYAGLPNSPKVGSSPRYEAPFNTSISKEVADGVETLFVGKEISVSSRLAPM